jgi:CheY-like chemotaxis protein
MGSGSERDRARDAGMNEYIAKPVKSAQLAAVLNRWSDLEKQL